MVKKISPVSKNQLLFIVAVLIAITIITTIVLQRNRGIRVETSIVQRGDIVSFISAPGKVRPVTEIKVSSDVGGRVTNLPVNEGQTVKKGQLLLQIDPTTYQAQVSQSKANVEQARANLQKSQAQWKRIQQLYKSRLISTEEMEASRAQYLLDLAQTKQAKAELVKALDDLNETTISSPNDGTITRLDIKFGEVVVTGTTNFAGTILMIIADLSLMRIECDVDEADISNVHPGENARLEFDAYPDTVFSGTVSEVGNAQRLDPQSSEGQVAGSQSPGTSSNISGTQAVSYTVKIAISEYKGNLKPDMSANVEIITASKKNALKVPIQAIIPQTITSNARSSQGSTKGTRSSYVVFSVDKNRAFYRPVITGLFGESEVEILKGITEGQVVITGPFSNLRLLKNNIKVQQIKPSPDDSNHP